jgi:hypothetical protein
MFNNGKTCSVCCILPKKELENVTGAEIFRLFFGRIEKTKKPFQN